MRVSMEKRQKKRRFEGKYCANETLMHDLDAVIAITVCWRGRKRKIVCEAHSRIGADGGRIHFRQDRPDDGSEDAVKTAVGIAITEQNPVANTANSRPRKSKAGAGVSIDRGDVEPGLTVSWVGSGPVFLEVGYAVV